MLSMPILNGRIDKWILALSEFELKFESAKAIKGQIIADFSLLSIVIRQLICLRLPRGHCSLMDHHVAKVVELGFC
jgi:hypothetical protein